MSPFVSQSLGPVASKEHAEDLQFVKVLIEEGKLTPVIDRTYSLSEAADALRYAQAGYARGQVVIAVRGADRG